VEVQCPLDEKIGQVDVVLQHSHDVALCKNEACRGDPACQDTGDAEPAIITLPARCNQQRGKHVETCVDGVGDAEARLRMCLGLGSRDCCQIHLQSRSHFFDGMGAVVCELVDAYELVISAALAGQRLEQHIISTRPLGHEHN